MVLVEHKIVARGLDAGEAVVVAMNAAKKMMGTDRGVVRFLEFVRRIADHLNYVVVGGYPLGINPVVARVLPIGVVSVAEIGVDNALKILSDYEKYQEQLREELRRAYVAMTPKEMLLIDAAADPDWPQLGLRPETTRLMESEPSKVWIVSMAIEHE